MVETSVVHAVSACPVCGSTSTVGFLSREGVPAHQNLVVKDQASAVRLARGTLNLMLCKECGFIFNRSFDPRISMYGEDYDNTQACSPLFSGYIDGLVRHMVLERGVRNCTVVEVGCGKGLFLRKLVGFEGAGITGRGFDPSYTGDEIAYGGRLKFEKRYYDAECADIPADFVVCRHVIEHVPKPVALVRDIRRALVNSPSAKVFLETPCVEWILYNRVIWDFFYEHCSYFSAGSLATAVEMAGFKVEEVEHIFNGQYLWLEAVVAPAATVVTRHPGDIGHLARQFESAEGEIVARWRTKIQQLAAKERLAIWGAGAKGVTFANLVDPRREWVDCLVDVNPQKQGRFVPGTGHPIRSYEALPAHGITAAILMNPNYRDEISTMLRSSGIRLQLIEGL